MVSTITSGLSGESPTLRFRRVIGQCGNHTDRMRRIIRSLHDPFTPSAAASVRQSHVPARQTRFLVIPHARHRNEMPACNGSAGIPLFVPLPIRPTAQHEAGNAVSEAGKLQPTGGSAIEL